MGWKDGSRKLYDRVLKKAKSPSEGAFDKYLQRKSNSLGLGSPQEALLVAAAEVGVGRNKEFRKLNEIQRGRVAQIIQGLGTQAKRLNSSESIKNSRKAIRLAQEIDSNLDPHLSNLVYQKLPIEGYSTMFILENSIREFIARVLFSKYGRSWWSEVERRKPLAGIASKVNSRKLTDSENWFHSKRGAHEVYYTDYTHLLQIISAFNSDFNKYFRKSPEKNLIAKLGELSSSRNVIAHNNPITKDDLERLKVHSGDWFKYMQYLYKQKG